MEPIKVLLRGGRRVGKTTVMASMADNLGLIEAVTNGNICCSADKETKTVLNF